MYLTKRLKKLLPQCEPICVQSLVLLSASFVPCRKVDEGEMLEEASRALPDIRRLILPLGFAEVDVRAFRSGAVSAIGVGRVAVAAAAGGVEITRVVGNGQMPL